MRSLFLVSFIALSACAAPGGPYPSLQPRAAEKIDPRVPIERPINDRPVTPALLAELGRLVEQARSGEAAFASAAAEAERLAAVAGPAQSDSWTEAQQAVSRAVAAREPAASAIADIDALGADALQKQGGIAPNDLAAIKRAGAEVGTLDRAQAERVKALQQRLGL